ncbi:MAG: YaaL family protein [Bacillota bacterium]
MAVKETLLKALSTWPQRLVADDLGATTSQPSASPSFLELVEQARQDWLAAKSYFESVSDPDLVDHAIYLVEAAETKYMYLIRKARADATS